MTTYKDTNRLDQQDCEYKTVRGKKDILYCIYHSKDITPKICSVCPDYDKIDYAIRDQSLERALEAHHAK